MPERINQFRNLARNTIAYNGECLRQRGAHLPTFYVKVTKLWNIADRADWTAAHKARNKKSTRINSPCLSLRLSRIIGKEDLLLQLPDWMWTYFSPKDEPLVAAILTASVNRLYLRFEGEMSEFQNALKQAIEGNMDGARRYWDCMHIFTLTLYTNF